ncbi:nuclease [Microbacterium testaceum]|uniref:nuclease n=1 Tax=Microbacterium testaceum TaxID=2033 RepID=UPI0022DF7383|nr:nuclease [Microbacterium testaceum]
MSRTISSTVHPIQRCMAASNPSAWWDGLVVAADGATVTVALLNGATTDLRVVGPAVDIAMGEPVAYHPVAELLSAAAITTTARAA